MLRPRAVLMLLPAVPLAVALLLPAGRPQQARAVPHDVRVEHSPYDPDWPTVALVLRSKCAGCHRPGTERQDLTTYESLMVAGHEEGMPIVVPGSLEESMLWEYTAWNVSADPHAPYPDSPEMPPERLDWLTEGQLAAIKRWIENGARKFLPGQEHAPIPLTELDFPSAKQCGACHPKQYSEWSRSMHAYAQQSPVFEAFTLTMVERTGGTIGTFCTRCHTPLGVTLGENESLRNVHRSRLSLEGVSCVVCHRRPDGHYKSSGRVPIAPGDLLEGCIYGPFENPVSQEHGAHPSQAQPYLRTSQFCGECHDVTSPAGVRLEEAFSEWHNSPAAREHVTCQMCHMGPVPGVPVGYDHRPLGRAAEVPGVDPERLPLRRLSDHTFAGPDYSLLPDTEFPHKLDWMYEVDYRDPDQLTPYQQRTLLELRRRNRAALAEADAQRYTLLRNAARIHVEHPATARPGESASVHVTVQSILSGHSFPTGFTAERQVWLAVDVWDAHGRLLYASGDFDSHGDLRDEHSRDVLAGIVPADLRLLNFQSKFVALSNKGTESSVVLSVNRFLQPTNVLRPATGISASFGHPPAFRVAKASLPPGGRARQAYPVRLPDTEGTCFVRVRLQFRHLPPALLHHIGTAHLTHLLEVVTLDEYQGTIEVCDSRGVAGPPPLYRIE